MSEISLGLRTETWGRFGRYVDVLFYWSRVERCLLFVSSLHRTSGIHQLMALQESTLVGLLRCGGITWSRVRRIPWHPSLGSQGPLTSPLDKPWNSRLYIRWLGLPHRVVLGLWLGSHRSVCRNLHFTIQLSSERQSRPAHDLRPGRYGQGYLGPCFLRGERREVWTVDGTGECRDSWVSLCLSLTARAYWKSPHISTKLWTLLHL